MLLSANLEVSRCAILFFLLFFIIIIPLFLFFTSLFSPTSTLLHSYSSPLHFPPPPHTAQWCTAAHFGLLMLNPILELPLERIIDREEGSAEDPLYIYICVCVCVTVSQSVCVCVCVTVCQSVCVFVCVLSRIG